MREQRNQILGTLVNQKALLAWAKAEGLDKNPKVQVEVTSALANAYFQVLVDRLVTKAEPTDDQLKAVYDEYAAHRPRPPTRSPRASRPSSR